MSEEASSQAPPAGVAPLRAHQIVSLLEVLDQYASIYSSLLESLSVLERDLRAMEKDGRGAEALGAEHAGMMLFVLNRLREEAARAGLERVPLEIARVRIGLEGTTSVAAAAEAAAAVRNCTRLDLVQLDLLPVKGKLSRYYREPLRGWDDVIAAFPDTKYDIKEASRCLALNRPTGCVFHLMRVAELGLHALARGLGVTHIGPTSVVRANWQNIIEKVESEVNKQKGDKATRKYYSAVLTRFSAVKEEWRNDTAHSRSRYTRRDAREVYKHVRSLMRRIAAGPPPPP